MLNGRFSAKDIRTSFISHPILASNVASKTRLGNAKASGIYKRGFTRVIICPKEKRATEKLSLQIIHVAPLANIPDTLVTTFSSSFSSAARELLMRERKCTSG